MKRPRIKTVKENPTITYIILPEYLKEKADLKNALKVFGEYKRMMDYAIEQGAKDAGIISGLYELLIHNCLESISNREHPKILNGGKYLKENGYRDDFLDDLY